jgi:PII-like signaling protein
MTETTTRIRIEILVSQPLARKIEAAAEQAGISGYTLLPTLGGKGRSGRWSDDQLTGADAHLIFLTVTSPEKADRLTDNLSDLLDSHGLILFRSPVEVIRAGKFA